MFIYVAHSTCLYANNSYEDYLHNHSTWSNANDTPCQLIIWKIGLWRGKHKIYGALYQNFVS